MSTIYRSEAGGREVLRRYREALAAWPVPSEQLHVRTREGETFVVASGPQDAPPVLLLHGAGANATTWQADIGSWARHFRTYAVDLIGEPGLSAPSRPPMDSEAYALWLDDVSEELGIDRVAVVGMSLGGWTALDYAIRRPGRVTRLAVLCPGGVGRQTYGYLPKVLLLRAFGRRGMRRSVQLVTGLDAAQAGPMVDQVALIFGHFRPRTERLPVFSDEALSGLAMPVLAVVGARDVMFDSEETTARLRRCVPRARVTLLPEAGHAILEQSDNVLAFLRE